MKCSFCLKETTDQAVKTCSGNEGLLYFPDTGEYLHTLPYEDPEGERCPDCRVASGGYHHPGCNMERCPRCGLQLISCSCDVAL